MLVSNLLGIFNDLNVRESLAWFLAQILETQLLYVVWGTVFNFSGFISACVCLFIYLFIYFAVPGSLWDLSSLTRDWISALGSDNAYS